MRHASSVAVLLTGAALLVPLPAAAETTTASQAPADPSSPPPAVAAPPVVAAPPAVVAVPSSTPAATPPLVERRSDVAMTGGIAGVAIGGILIVSGALSGGLQAACSGTCHHLPTIIGLVTAGSALIAAGIPLIIYGARIVPVAGPGPGVALVPKKPLPAWAGAPGTEGWAFRF